jgi:hypothetical protein
LRTVASAPAERFVPTPGGGCCGPVVWMTSCGRLAVGVVSSDANRGYGSVVASDLSAKLTAVALAVLSCWR